MKTFTPHFVKKIYSLWRNEFHMKRVKIGSIDCYEYNNQYYRLDTFYDGDELHYCIEIADNREEAENNIFEDAWLYGEELGIDQIISEMREDLKK